MQEELRSQKSVWSLGKFCDRAHVTIPDDEDYRYVSKDADLSASRKRYEVNSSHDLKLLADTFGLSGGY